MLRKIFNQLTYPNLFPLSAVQFPTFMDIIKCCILCAVSVFNLTMLLGNAIYVMLFKYNNLFCSVILSNQCKLTNSRIKKKKKNKNINVSIFLNILIFKQMQSRSFKIRNIYNIIIQNNMLCDHNAMHGVLYRQNRYIL